jgi:hypothetical protein
MSKIQRVLWASSLDNEEECRSCGSFGARTVYFGNPKKDSHYDTRIPEEVLCDDCIKRTDKTWD